MPEIKTIIHAQHHTRVVLSEEERFERVFSKETRIVSSLVFDGSKWVGVICHKIRKNGQPYQTPLKWSWSMRSAELPEWLQELYRAHQARDAELTALVDQFKAEHEVTE